MKRELNNLHFDRADLPIPQECYHALMDAARSVKEEEPMKRASFRAVLIAAIIIIAMTAVAFAADQLGWVDFFGSNYGVTMPKAAEETLIATKPQTFAVGPMTFTFNQLLTDGHIVLSSAEVRMTDGSEALIADDSNLNEAVDAISDVVLKKYNLESGITWVEAAKQLHLPLYGVRALAEVAPEYVGDEAMEDALWNEDGSIVYFNMPALNQDAVKDELSVTLYMAVHPYDPATDEIKLNQWMNSEDVSLAVSPLLAERTYLPDGSAELNGMTLVNVKAEQYATGVYLTSTFTMPEGKTADEARDALYALALCDASGTELPMGLSLSGNANVDKLPDAALMTMTSLDTLPESLVITDGITKLTVK